MLTLNLSSTKYLLHNITPRHRTGVGDCRRLKKADPGALTQCWNPCNRKDGSERMAFIALCLVSCDFAASVGTHLLHFQSSVSPQPSVLSHTEETQNVSQHRPQGQNSQLLL